MIRTTDTMNHSERYNAPMVELYSQSTTRRIAVLISGRGSNMLALVEAWRDGRIPGADFALVLSDRAAAPGIERAREHGIHTIIEERGTSTRLDHERRILEHLRAHRIDLICLAGFTRLLSPAFIAEFRDSILNIHPSLLPAFPGLDAQRQAIDYGVRISGCTVHFVDETLDGGAIIDQRHVPVLDDDTEETLAARILVQEHKLYPEALARIISGDYRIEGRRVLHGSTQS